MLAPLSLFAFTTNVMAASDADACFASGGIDYVKEGGVGTCIYPVGNSDNTKEVSQKGSFASSQDSTLTNPGGNQPAGQTNKDDIPK